MQKAFDWWTYLLEEIIGNLASVTLLATTLLAGVEIIRRYLFGTSFPWQQDVITYVSISALFLFFSISQNRDTHFKVTLLLETIGVNGDLGQAFVRWLNVITMMVTLVMIIMFTAWGWPELLRSISKGRYTDSLIFLVWPFYALLIASFALMAVSAFFQLFRQLQVAVGKEPLKMKYVEEQDGDKVL